MSLVRLSDDVIVESDMVVSVSISPVHDRLTEIRLADGREPLVVQDLAVADVWETLHAVEGVELRDAAGRVQHVIPHPHVR